MSFRPELCPGPRWGAHDAPPDLLVGWGGDIHPHTPPSALAMRSPRILAKSTPMFVCLRNGCAKPDVRMLEYAV